VFYNYHDICITCNNKSEKHIKSISGENSPNFGKESLNKGKKLEEIYEEEKAKELKELFRKNNLGKKLSEETKEKMRDSAINRIEIAKFNDEQLTPNFNRTGCQLIEQYGKDNGYTFQHAMNGTERKIKGYFPDGYDKDRNTIIEIDEPYHENPIQKEKDVIRQKNLIEHLKCDFIRIKVDDNYNILDTIIFKYQPII
jgi:hypothetical protein